MQTMDERTPIASINCYSNNNGEQNNNQSINQQNASLNMTNSTVNGITNTPYQYNQQNQNQINNYNNNSNSNTSSNNLTNSTVSYQYQANQQSQQQIKSQPYPQNNGQDGKSPSIRMNMKKKGSYFDQPSNPIQKVQNQNYSFKGQNSQSPSKKINSTAENPNGYTTNASGYDGSSPLRPKTSLLSQTTQSQFSQILKPDTGSPLNQQNILEKQIQYQQKGNQQRSKERQPYTSPYSSSNMQNQDKVVAKKDTKKGTYTSYKRQQVANEKITKKLIIDLNTNQQGGNQNQNQNNNSSSTSNNRNSKKTNYQSGFSLLGGNSRYRESSLDNSFTRKPTYNSSFRKQSKSPLRYGSRQKSGVQKQNEKDKNSSFSVNNSLNNSEFNSSQDNQNPRTLTSSFSRLCLKSKKGYGKSPNSHREINKLTDTNNESGYILQQLNEPSTTTTKNNTSLNKYKPGSSQYSQNFIKRSSTPKIQLNKSIGKLKTESFQNTSIQNSKFTSSSRTSLSKTTYNNKFGKKETVKKDVSQQYDKNNVLDKLHKEEEDDGNEIIDSINNKPSSTKYGQGSPNAKHMSNAKHYHYPFTFEVNTQNFPNLQLNMEEVKKDRQRLIRKIQATFKVKNKAPSTSQEFYKILHVIGKGAFAKVCLGLQLLTGKFVAIKLIDKAMLRSEGAKNRVLQEVLILKKLNGSKNIIKLLEVFENRKLIFVITEFIDGNDLMQIMKQREGRPFPEFEVQTMLIQILNALKHCQNNMVLHRDIKLDNILLDKKFNIKMIDFGISRIIYPNQKMTEQCGTPAFLAPEIISNKGYEGFGSDIWSLGILLYILLYGRVPFKGNNLNELHRNITNGVLPIEEMQNHDVSQEAQDLLKKIMVVNVKERIDFQGIVSHPWLYNFNLESSSSIGSGQNLNDNNNGNNQKTALNEEYISYIEQFGYSRDYIYRCLEKNGLSHVNAVYYLLSQNKGF